MKYAESNRERNRRELNEVLDLEIENLLNSAVLSMGTNLHKSRKLIDMSRQLYLWREEDYYIKEKIKKISFMYLVTFVNKRGID